MPLQIIAGSSGSGKSQYIYEKIVEEARLHPEQNFLILVPEQFNLLTQKRLTALHPQGCLLNIDVLSFNRLGYRVFQEVGGSVTPVLEEWGKNMIVQKVVWDNKKNLKILGGTMQKTGAISEMKSLISEFMQYGVHPDDLEDWMSEREGESKSLLRYKLGDVHKIYQGFADYLESRYLTTEEVPEILAAVIGQSEYIRNCTIVLDGYTGFTPVQLPLVKELLMLSRKVWAVVTMEKGRDPLRYRNPANLFYMSSQMIRSLTELAADAKVETEEIIWIPDTKKSRFADNPSLAFLEKQLFRPGRRETWQGECNISITESMTPEQELVDIAEQILYQVREKGCCYKEMAVVTGDLDGYGRLAEEIFNRAGIPVFVDQNAAILQNQLVEYIRASVDMVVRNFSYESVVRYLRSGMSGFGREEADLLDQYLLALGIRGRNRYEDFWTRSFRGMKEEQLLKINDLRVRFCEETASLTEGLKKRGGTLLDKTMVLVKFLQAGKQHKRCMELSESFSGKGEKARANEFRQIYPAVMDGFNKAVEILGKEKMGLKEYQQILDAMFEEIGLGLIPPGGDQVLVGDIERSRLSDVKVLFFAGLNEGIVPKAVSKGGLLSETDRDYLKGEDLPLAPGERERMYQQRFYLYLNMTKPSEKLFLSYSKMDTKGAARLPSYLIGVIRKLYPDLQVENRTDVADASREGLLNLETPEGRMQVLIAGFQNPEQAVQDPVWKELYSWFRNTVDRAAAEEMLEAAFFENQTTRISKAVARVLYGDVLMGSVTRLEQYAACAYAHFLNYGLRLKERPVYEITPADMGTVLHNSLERYAKMLDKEGLSWAGLDPDKRRELSAAALDSCVHDENNTIFHSTMRNQHLISRMQNMLDCTLEVLQTHVERGEFQPSGFEIRFPGGETLESVQIPLEDGASMRLNGQIDRLDLLEADDTIYIKIIDYKTGNNQLDLSAVYYGLQLQLTVYMNVAMEQQRKLHPDKNIEPAGAFLFHIKDPFVENEGDSILDQMKMSGLVRAEREVASLMDENLAVSGKSEVIPVGYNKDGALSKASRALEHEGFETVRRFVDRKVRSIGNEIMEGSIEINPYLMGQQNACTYCQFKGICNFDRRLPGYHFRKLYDADAEVIIEKMKGEV